MNVRIVSHAMQGDDADAAWWAKLATVEPSWRFPDAVEIDAVRVDAPWAVQNYRSH